MTENWPRYEPVTFTKAVNVSPENLDILNRAGLPKVGLGVGNTVEEPVGVNVPGRGYLIRFAPGPRGSLYYEPSTGQVLEGSDIPGVEPGLVNSTLEQFTRTVKTLIEAFPFYEDLGRDLNEVDVDTLGEMYEASAARLADLIREIDPVALDPDTYWPEFLLDVMNGDYGTEDILRSERS